jgi:integrase
MREGRHFKTAESKRHTLGDLIDRFVVEVLPHKSKNASNTKLHLLWWKTRLGHITLADLGPADIVTCRNEFALDGDPAQASSVAVDCGSLHGGAVARAQHCREGLGLARRLTDAQGFRSRVNLAARERFLSDKERDALLTACRDSTSRYLYPVVVLAISTGMRSGEMLTLRWPQVDLRRGQILLQDTKNGASRAVPLAGHALDLIEQLSKVQRIDTDLLFPGADASRPVDLKKPWTTALRKAGIVDFRFHDLRHSAASYLAMNGASTIEIAAVLGHKTLQMVKRYSHLSSSHTTTVVSSMNQKIFGVKA